MITVTLRARTRKLSTVARLKEELGITVTTYDERLGDLLEEVSADVEGFLGYPLRREGVTETCGADGGQTLAVARFPIVRLDAARFYDTTASGVMLENPDAGILYRQEGFSSTLPLQVDLQPLEGPPPGYPAWAFDYLAGYLTRADDVVASGLIAVASGERTLTRSAGAWPLLASGDAIEIAGFAEAANSGTFTVASRSALVLTVLEEVATEAAGSQTVTIRVRTLPAEIERAALDEAKNRWLRAQRDTSISSERIGDWAATYAGAAGEGQGLSPSVASRLAMRRRIV
jgi:hypothetical protein